MMRLRIRTIMLAVFVLSLILGARAAIGRGYSALDSRDRSQVQYALGHGFMVMVVVGTLLVLALPDRLRSLLILIVRSIVYVLLFMHPMIS
jgi:hypothetical protein